HFVRRIGGLLGSRLRSGLAFAVPADAALDGGEQRVVVAREPLVHEPFEAETAHPWIERLVALGEVDARAAVAEILEALEPFGSRPQRLAHGVLAPRLVRPDLREPPPRLAHSAGEQDARDGERAVAHEAVPDVVAGMQDVDRPDLVLRAVVAAIPEDLPHLLWRRVHVDRERMLLHVRDPTGT